YRETSNIKDGSNIMAEMSTECFAGNAARGMSMVTLHNGGGVGISKVSNSGFGMVLDGSERVNFILERAFPWDVMCGVARRAWARNENSIETAIEHNEIFKDTDHITLPFISEKGLIKKIVNKKLNE
ncbi:MAG: urocanate hydratase, partial [Candidatus Cloacimonetes bacterium]|nr:urocanate hydratase [Candidatus Cloacimonadota bacterium]